MSDLINQNSNDLIGLLHNAGGMAIPKPFEREIHLFDSYIAGTTHIEGIDELEPHLNIGEKLLFLREPDNIYDSNAITINTESGVKIGYVPERDNIIFSRLMDAGKELFSRITEKEIRGKWVYIKIRIFLQD